MKLQFDPNQQYQREAIAAVLGLFAGQAKLEAATLTADAGLAVVANRLDLWPEDLIANLQAVQTANDIKPDNDLHMIDEPIQTREGQRQGVFYNFSIEMETGTGKTYVYLRTALELYRDFGYRKFIIVVPSVAVREGVLSTLRITREHFRDLYQNPTYRYYAYDAASLNNVRKFANSDSMEIMVMTLAAFNKLREQSGAEAGGRKRRGGNVIYRDSDQLLGETPIHLIQSARPILILDEPQNMESEISVKALANLNPLLALRYSATHRNPYNTIHRLTPYAAYQQGLVKQIEVAAVTQTLNANRPYLHLREIVIQNKRAVAKMVIHRQDRLGKISAVELTIGTETKNHDLEVLSGGLPGYKGYRVAEINHTLKLVRFHGQGTIRVGEQQGNDREAIFRAQIGYTIQKHADKQNYYDSLGLGIKVLSLFFIDKVANYQAEDGMIRRLFDEEFAKVQGELARWRGKTAGDVRKAYFANKRQKSGEVEYFDLEGNNEKEREAEAAAYRLIMQEKEVLLNFDEATDFIFSHSALREGWDNPNIFQICTLNQTGSEIKKRQEVGRGLRLAVDQTGVRVRDEGINLLTVVANESYQDYVSRLQAEIAEAYGSVAEAAPVSDALNRPQLTATLRHDYMTDPNLPYFRELWARISRKTRYTVEFSPSDIEAVIANTVAELDSDPVQPPRINIDVATVTSSGEQLDYIVTSGQTVGAITATQPRGNVVQMIAALLERGEPNVRLPRKAILTVYQRCAAATRTAALGNLYEFALQAASILKRQLGEQMVAVVRYELTGEEYSEAMFKDSFQFTEPRPTDTPVFHSRQHSGVGSSLYDLVPLDSQVEHDFAEGMEKLAPVKLYIKLPRWFVVETPIGSYNPDWAIVYVEPNKAGETLYLIRETKDAKWPRNARPDEVNKVKSGYRHFYCALDVDYKVVTSVSDLLAGRLPPGTHCP